MTDTSAITDITNAAPTATQVIIFSIFIPPFILFYFCDKIGEKRLVCETNLSLELNVCVGAFVWFHCCFYGLF